MNFEWTLYTSMAAEWLAKAALLYPVCGTQLLTDTRDQ